MSFWNAVMGWEVSGDIAISLAREDRPKFKRVYVKVLDSRAKVTVTMRTTMFGDRDASGELTQPNGKWVLFDPNAIADKILDPILVPLVQSFVDEVHRADGAFMAAKPSEFVDEGGTTWRRA